MTHLTCENCGADISHDDFAEVYVGNFKRLHASIWLCAKCREEHYQQLERDADQASREPLQ